MTAWGRSLAGLLALFAAGCGGEEPEAGVRHLSEGFQPEGEFRLDATGRAVAERLVGGDEWRNVRVGNLWELELRAPPCDPLGEGGLRLGLPGGGRQWQPDAERRLLGVALGGELAPSGLFTSIGDRLFASFQAGPPELLELSYAFTLGEPVGGRWRAPIGDGRADGLPIWTGQPVVLDGGFPGQAQLSFGTYVPLREGSPRYRLRVRWGDTEIYDRDLEPRHTGGIQWHTLSLLNGGQRGKQLSFELEGPPALAAILCPTLRLGPSPPDPRPDLVVFLADTFRADNLGCYGSELELSPRIDAFARESLRFTRAWSPASWTLPSQSSMLSAAWPGEHGATSPGRRLPAELITLAEVLAANGYRTAAFTEGAYVSASYGLDQGFEIFDEGSRNVHDTLARALAFLERYEERPTFLFVQTYCTHVPYEVEPRTLEEHSERLGIDRRWNDLLELGREQGWGFGGAGRVTDETRAAGRALERHYRGQVLDLDRAFGELLDGLESRGSAANPWIVFTSDHGEAFGEHDTFFHGSHVWEEHVRVPLLIRPPRGSERAYPAAIDHAASLVDLPRTLADIAGVDAPALWRGTSLLDLAAERATFSFGGNLREGEVLAIIEGPRKAIFSFQGDLEAPAPLGVFDLERDPGERSNLSGDSAGWSAEILARNLPRLRELFVPLAAPAEAQVSPAQAEHLKAMGYTGE